MRVTEIIPLDKRRSKVCTDADFAFALYGGEIRRYKLEAGGVLSDEVYHEILRSVLCPRAKERAMYLLRSHDRTEEEIRRKLREGLYPQEAVDAALAFLREYGLVNDDEYGRRYVETYGRRRSRRRLQSDLARRGLTRRQIEELLSGGEIQEEEQIREFLRKNGYDREECGPAGKRKLLSALLRRGYSYETVSRVMGEAEADAFTEDVQMRTVSRFL